MEIVKFEDTNAIEHTRSGEVIAFPTETVYGLGVRYDNFLAYQKLVEIKRRPPDKPFTVMCGKKEDISRFAVLSEGTKAVIDAFVPGPITLILKPKPGLYPWVTLAGQSIGIRVPGLEPLRNFIRAVGAPLLVPSANKSGLPPCKNVQEIVAQFGEEVKYLIDGGEVDGKPSTIVEIIDDHIELVRQGELDFDSIKAVFEKGNTK